MVTFFRRYQAGFTVTAPDPIGAFCDTVKMDGDSPSGQAVFGRLSTLSCNESDLAEPDQTCPVYTSRAFTNCTANTLTSMNGSCYNIDPIIASLLPVGDTCTHAHTHTHTVQYVSVEVRA